LEETAFFISKEVLNEENICIRDATKKAPGDSETARRKTIHARSQAKNQFRVSFKITRGRDFNQAGFFL
jgi:hypothetical protein